MAALVNDAQGKIVRKRNAMTPNSHEAITLRRFCSSLGQQNYSRSSSSNENNNDRQTLSSHLLNGRRPNTINNVEDPYSSDSATEVVMAVRNLVPTNNESRRPFGAPSA